MASPSVSVVCVFNDEAMLADCLNASVVDNPQVDLIAVDNSDGRFGSAGAALNYGASLSEALVVAFVHQDVYLHALDRLLSAADVLLRGDGWGIIGSSGVDESGAWIGRLRDRVLLVGDSAETPVEVQTLDEVAFLIRRDIVLRSPITEDPDLAWHAYAVEYALRVRARGERVGAMDLAISHNSRSVNLDRLDVAHARIRSLYPEEVPIRTSVGVVGGRMRNGWRGLPGLRDHRWRGPWLHRSVQARALARRGVAVPIVFGDIRHDVDRLTGGSEVVHVVNVDTSRGFLRHASTDVGLHREGRPFRFSCVASAADASASLEESPLDAAIVIADLTADEVPAFLARHPDRAWRVGLQPGSVWLVGGRAADPGPSSWQEARHQPSKLVLGSTSRNERAASRFVALDRAD